MQVAADPNGPRALPPQGELHQQILQSEKSFSARNMLIFLTYRGSIIFFFQFSFSNHLHKYEPGIEPANPLTENAAALSFLPRHSR